jgi:hypothetical protein
MGNFDEFRQERTVKRFTGGGYDASGFYNEGTESQFPIKCSVQNPKGQEMMLLDENRRDTAVFRIYADTQLFTASKSSQNPDRVVLDDGDYEVVKVMPWQNNIINHYKYLISKVVSND